MNITNLIERNKSQKNAKIISKLILNQKGFTLIELLIVIVIIAILAGVVIGVLNPVQQQNRARDGVIRSSLTKAALTAKSLQISTARRHKAPTAGEFTGAIGNISTFDCLSAVADPFDSDETCLFTITGIRLPSTCDASGFNGTGSNPCRFVYWRGRTTGTTIASSFRIGIKTFSTNNPVLFVYQYAETTQQANEAFYSCGSTYSVPTTDASTSPLCTFLD
jgi:prepilin-type N-terminal cleavage/methylation domain-containing protein